MKIIFFKKKKSWLPSFSDQEGRKNGKLRVKKTKNISHFLRLSPSENEMSKLAGLLLTLEIAKFIFITIE